MKTIDKNYKAFLWALLLTILLSADSSLSLSVCGNGVLCSEQPLLSEIQPEYISTNAFQKLQGGLSMQNDYINYRNGDFLFDKGKRRYSFLEPDEQLLHLEKELRQRNLIYSFYVQKLLKIAAYGSCHNSQWSREKLQEILEADRILDMRTGSVFRPLAPSQLLSQGDLHLLNQVDGVPWMVSRDTLTRGVLLTGPQGGGKTRLLISLCRQLCNFNPPIPFFLIDPKQELAGWSNYLNATYISMDENCDINLGIDLSPPPGQSYRSWLTSLMPLLGETIGVIYGVELLQDAATICIAQLEKLQQSGKPGQLCLNDINEALQFVPQTTSGRRSGYREGASTGIARILRGSGNLFKCRQGINLASLFQNHNVILGCRAITDEFAAKFLAVYILWYLHEMERFSSPTSKLRRVLILDDATRFLAARSGFDAASCISTFTHTYATLRSSGNGIIATTQIPHLTDPGILALSHTVLCVGGLHYGQDTRLLAQMLSLNPDQQQAIAHLRQREAIGISAGSAWPHVVHGFTLDVPDTLKGSK